MKNLLYKESEGAVGPLIGELEKCLSLVPDNIVILYYSIRGTRHSIRIDSKSKSAKEIQQEIREQFINNRKEGV